MGRGGDVVGERGDRGTSGWGCAYGLEEHAYN